jgi:hypothetical protein
MNVPFKQAVISLLRSSDSRIHLRYELKDGLITVGRMRAPFDFTERGKGKVVAHLRGANALQVVTKLLLHYGPVSYTLDPALLNTTITADINGQTLDEALKIVRRGASSPIFIKVENGIYKFNPTPSLQDLQ